MTHLVLPATFSAILALQLRFVKAVFPQINFIKGHASQHVQMAISINQPQQSQLMESSMITFWYVSPALPSARPVQAALQIASPAQMAISLTTITTASPTVLRLPNTIAKLSRLATTALLSVVLATVLVSISVSPVTLPSISTLEFVITHARTASMAQLNMFAQAAMTHVKTATRLLLIVQFAS